MEFEKINWKALCLQVTYQMHLAKSLRLFDQDLVLYMVFVKCMRTFLMFFLPLDPFFLIIGNAT